MRQQVGRRARPRSLTRTPGRERRGAQRDHLVEDALGHLALRGERHVAAPPVAPQQHDRVGLAAEARARGRDVVRHDQVEVLGLELAARVGEHVVGLGREADQQPPALRRRPGLQDVGRAHELEAASAASVFLSFDGLAWAGR